MKESDAKLSDFGAPSMIQYCESHEGVCAGIYDRIFINDHLKENLQTAQWEGGSYYINIYVDNI